MELKEIHESAEEQTERAGELKEEVEAHQERVEKLDAALSDLRATSEQVNSDGAREAMGQLQEARKEVERLIEEKRAEQQKLLDENEEMGRENGEAYQKSRQALKKVQNIADMMGQAGGQEGSLPGFISDSLSAAQQDVNDRVEVDRSLLIARQKLQPMF